MIENLIPKYSNNFEIIREEGSKHIIINFFYETDIEVDEKGNVINIPISSISIDIEDAKALVDMIQEEIKDIRG